MTIYFKFFLPIAFLLIFTTNLIAKDVQVVPNLDLSRFQGQWYEIAKFPNAFQKKCYKNTTAVYTLLEDGNIEVKNSCTKKNGKTQSVTGLARRQEENTQGKLEVSFFKILGLRPIWGSYWVLEIDEDYTVAVVGDHKQKNGWILAREKSIPPTQLKRALAAFNRNGYDSDALEFTTQD